MTVTVNGTPHDLPSDVTLADLVGQLTQSPKGVAAAVNGEVVPRSSWAVTPLRRDDQVEVVTAVQGG